MNNTGAFVGCRGKRAIQRLLARFGVQLVKKYCDATDAASLSAEIIARHCPDNSAFDAFKEKGYFLLRDHFYLPLPDYADLTEAFLESRSDLVGVDIDEEPMWNLAEKTLAAYHEEFRSFPVHCPSGGYDGFYLINHGYMAVDGNLYYGLVRHMKPRRIVETGCGSSSLLCSEALARNMAEGYETKYTCIEPYPQSYLLQNSRLKFSTLIEKKIQHVDYGVFTELEENDILFIDTSHALRMGGDVQYIYCELLPRLRPGVYVHIHDISLPRQYPRVYHEQAHYYWNEQYLLQAYLTNNNNTEVVWAGNWLRLRDEARFGSVFPEFSTMREYFPSSEPSAFWFKTR